MNVERGLKKFLHEWVKKNFGESEADDPSWNIDDLAHALKEEFDKINYKIETLNLRADVEMVAFDKDITLTEDELKWVVGEYRISEGYNELNRPCIEYLLERVKGREEEDNY